VQTPRREVTTFPPRLDRSGASLPWARCSISTIDPRVKDRADGPAILMAAAVACSRTASAGSGPCGRRPAIAARRVSRPRGAGGAGGRHSVIGPPSTASSAAERRANATANACTRPAPRPQRRPSRPSQPSRARASAQRKFHKIFRAARAIGRAATSCLSPRPARRCSTSVRPPAVRRYVASASVSCGSASAAATGSAPGRGAAAHRRCGMVDVVDYFPGSAPAVSFPDPTPEKGAGGPGYTVPPFPFSALVGRDGA
jgi:hypothetical protein